jgi:hypothetical protein
MPMIASVPMVTSEFPHVMTLMPHGRTVHGGAPSELIELATLKRHPLLKDAASKLQYAELLLGALTTSISDAFADPADQPVLGVYLDSMSGSHVFRVNALPDLDDFAEILTHAISNVALQVRAALDKLAWKCACKYANGIPKNRSSVKFPICDTPDAWQKQEAARKKLDPAHWAFIDKVQPYHGGYLLQDDAYAGRYIHPLTLLRELSNDDKHADTTPALLTQGVFSFRKGITFARRANDPFEHLDIDETGIGHPMALGSEVMRARLIDPPFEDLDDAGRVIPTVEIGEGRIADDAMRRLHRSVHFILSEFARQFP